MKTEALEVLKNRRSIRKFKPEQVSSELLDIILEAGTYAPTGMNTQSPTIVAVQNAEDVKTLNRLNGAVMNNPDGTPYYGAPTIILVLADPNDGVGEFDAALVGGNMLNAAYAVGLGSCWIHRSKEVFESEGGKALLKKWGLPEDLVGVCSIALGVPDCPHPEARPRKEGYIVKV